MLNLLSFIFFPLVSAVGIFFCKALSKHRQKSLAIVLSLVPLLMLFANSVQLDSSIHQVWFSDLKIHFNLEIDGLSLIFIYLTNFIIPISILTVRQEHIEKTYAFYSLILVLQTFLLIFFTAQDLVVFTIFWEAMLIPLYFIITLWGQHKKERTAFKFLLYMIAGSFLMVVGVLTLFFEAHTFSMRDIAPFADSLPHAKWILLTFLLAFAVKTPLFPFHAWLPEVYVNSPTAGTILLSALLSKAGVYGILRIGIGMFPNTLQEWNPLLISLAITGVFYGGLVAWRQHDFKRLIAYSSFSHVNLILTGLFFWNSFSHVGAILQVINHSLTITALFLSVAWLENRLETTEMIFSGLAKYMPRLCWLTFFFVLSSVGLPGLNNFVGELLIFFGIFQQNHWVAALLALSIVLSVIYMLRFMQKIYFKTPSDYEERWVDIGKKEFGIALPLILGILIIGLYPKPLLQNITSLHGTVILEKKENS